MSGDLTRPLPGPRPQPAYAARRPRKRRRWPVAVLAGLVVLVLLAVGDRVAAAYAGNRTAQQLQQHGFPGRPSVTFEGFPFLTQYISRDFRDVRITAAGVQAGPVTASLSGDATGVRLDPGYQSGTISKVTGTVLVSFASLAHAVRAAGVPAVKVSRAGPHQVKLKVDLQVFTTTAVASIGQAGTHTFRIHVISAGGLPASLLGSLGDFTFTVPKLPYGLDIQRVHVTGHGVAGRLSGRDIRFPP